MKTTKYYEALIIVICAFTVLSLLFLDKTEKEILTTAFWALVSIVGVLVAGFIHLNEYR